MLTIEEIAQKIPEEIYFLLNQLDSKTQGLKKDNLNLESKLKKSQTEIEALTFKLNKVLHKKYAQQSEKLANVLQARLFNEQADGAPAVEIEEDGEFESDAEAIPVESHTRKRGRKKLPAFLPRVREEHDILESEKQCHCGCELKKIGEETSEKLEFIPAKVRVIEVARLKYACPECEGNVKIASVPAQVIPKSIATPGLLSHIFVSKFCDALPFYRLETILKRIGVEISRGTFCRWAITCSQLLAPLVDRLQSHIVNYDVSFADETKLQVLKEDDRTPDQLSYMWLFVGGDKAHRSYVYQYNPSRSHHVPDAFYQGFKGYLHCDAYSAYLTLSKKNNVIVLVHCLAHARRRFVDIIKLSKKCGVAQTVVKEMAKLYGLEKKFKQQNLSPAQIYQQRQKKSKLILIKLKNYLNEKSQQSIKSEALSDAINYCLKHWVGLTRYLEDGRLDIDNNRSERGIKPFVIGRKAWLFHDNPEGAKAGSLFYSLIETCKAHQIEPYAYLKYALMKIRQCQNESNLDQLLPFNVDQNELAKMYA